MRQKKSQLALSATDLANHLGCRHITSLDLMAAHGRAEPPVWVDPALAILRERGFEHERAYLDYLRDELSLSVVEIEGVEPNEAASEQTIVSMRQGAEIITQTALRGGRWRGRADVLRRVERPSALGDWSYEVVDTKLAQETRAGTILQLCLYSDLVADIQRLMPEFMYVVSPERLAEPQQFRTHDFLAYYRFVRQNLDAAVAEPPDDDPKTYPDPVAQCDMCRWWTACDRRWRKDDHLSLVSGITRLQRRELNDRGVDTLAALASVSIPLDPKPARGSMEGYERAHHQARVQLESRAREAPVYEVLQPIEPGQGIARLPEPSAGDVFFDIESARYFSGGGLEYLFGWVYVDGSGGPEYRSDWALDRPGERGLFEAFIDEMMARWEQYPGFHIYHFAPYEPAALKRLMGRHGTREEEVDRLLRGKRLVDLYAAVRQGVRVGVERYSLKDLEALHGYVRETDLREASKYLRAFERLLELGDPESIPGEVRDAVLSYNRDDCMSTLALRDWLEGVRSELEAGGETIPRPELEEGKPSEKLDERRQRTLQLVGALCADVPELPEERSEDQHSLWLLAQMLEWHRREGKATWWEKFRLEDLSEEDFLEEKPALSGLEFVKTVGGTAACPIHRYRFPMQEHDVRKGQTLHAPGGDAVGGAAALDLRRRLIDIKKRSDASGTHPTGVFAHDWVNPAPLPESLELLGEWVVDHGIDSTGDYRAARDLLMRRSPRLVGHTGGPLRRSGEPLLDAARRLGLELDGGVLPIQGPPGSGKTYMGARMICELIAAGKKVGVTALSHKVIRNLLDEVINAAREAKVALRCIQKVREPSEDPPAEILETKSNSDVIAALASGSAKLAAGTGWLWARPDMAASVDVLFIDEAGQMSLANALAVARAAKSLVLLGDPQQLEQPLHGSHPEGAAESVLQHLIGEHETMPDDRGLFLEETWRLHPDICAFTSEVFYESRLDSRPGLERQALVGPTPFAGAGLWFVPVEHEGNRSSSPEEVERIAEIFDSFLADGVGWIDAKGKKRPLGLEDILVVAPFNAQVGALSERLPEGARIGTVDKFQGQEAPVVLYSMTTSSPEEAPRGMEFLYSLHRLNVATSRARCVSVLVASPPLLEPDCRTPHQMHLANALCRYAELARTL